jgi:hypothetical protein
MAKKKAGGTRGTLCWTAAALEELSTFYPRARLTLNGLPGVVVTMHGKGRETTFDFTPMSDEERRSFEGPLFPGAGEQGGAA